METVSFRWQSEKNQNLHNRLKLVFATHNKNKLEEVRRLMPASVELLSLDDIGCHEDIDETAETIEGNALLKAQYVLENYNTPCFADDSGLEVTALGGAPGVYSARYAGPQRDANDNNRKLLNELEGKQDRSARFKTVIALVSQNKELLFEGICNGEIIEDPRGDKGFGYDPIFLPDGFDHTFAEMSMEQKGVISHRGLAISKLVEFLSTEI